MKLFHTWLLRLLGIMLVVSAGMVLLMPTLLLWWIGVEELPPQSGLISQILCIGVMGRTLEMLSTSMIHAYGRADLIAKVRMIEVPLYIVFIYFMITKYGAYGATIAYVTRVVLDAIILYALVRKVPSMTKESHTTATNENNRRGDLDRGKLAESPSKMELH